MYKRKCLVFMSRKMRVRQLIIRAREYSISFAQAPDSFAITDITDIANERLFLN